eukprot:7126090-Prymnesium_polylepis.1
MAFAIVASLLRRATLRRSSTHCDPPTVTTVERLTRSIHTIHSIHINSHPLTSIPISRIHSHPHHPSKPTRNHHSYPLLTSIHIHRHPSTPTRIHPRFGRRQGDRRVHAAGVNAAPSLPSPHASRLNCPPLFACLIRCSTLPPLASLGAHPAALRVCLHRLELTQFGAHPALPACLLACLILGTLPYDQQYLTRYSPPSCACSPSSIAGLFACLTKVLTLHCVLA